MQNGKLRPRIRGGAIAATIRLACIGNWLPRRCGIATFTTDLQQAIARSRRGR